MPLGAADGEPVNADMAAVLGKIPSGLFIVTARSADGRETGLLASWVQQAAFEPPMLTVAINGKRYLNDWLLQSPGLGVNVLAEEQKDLLKHFAAGFEPDAAAFAGLNVVRGETGVPLLADALGYLEGRVVSQMTTGDHTIYAVELIHAGLHATDSSRRPWVHLRKNGLRY